MNVASLGSSPANDPTARRPQSPEAAARQFEEVLARQFVQVMTDGLFKSSLSGEEGPGWMQGQAEAQRDVMTDVLARHLTENGALGIADLLLRQWDVARAEEDRSQREEKGTLRHDHLGNSSIL